MTVASGDMQQLDGLRPALVVCDERARGEVDPIGQRATRTIKRAARPLVHAVRRRRALLALRRAAPTDAVSAALITATHQALHRHPSPSERAWIDRIERQRELLVMSTETFTFEALGARRSAPSEQCIGRIAASASKTPNWAYLLFRLVREWRPTECIELGACVGISAAYQAAALELNGSGRLATLEGSSRLADQARETLADLALAERASVVTGSFAETLAGVLAERSGRIDYVFIDGHHDGAATLHYLEQMLPHLANEALIAFDDITWSADMRNAWEHITRDARFASTLDAGIIGFATWRGGRGGSGESIRVSYA